MAFLLVADDDEVAIDEVEDGLFNSSNRESLESTPLVMNYLLMYKRRSERKIMEMKRRSERTIIKCVYFL